VARRLGVSHQAPYKHYPSRDHLLAEVVRRAFAAFADHLDARPREADAFADLHAMGRAYLDFALRHPLHYRLIFGTPLPDAEAHPEMMSRGRHAFALLETLTGAAAVPGVRLVLLTDRPRIERIRDLVVAGNTAQMTDPAFLRELTNWLRFNPRAAMAHADGLFSGASGRPAVPSWLGPTLFRGFTTATSENDAYARQIRSSAGIAVFVAERADHEHWVRVGLACQRFALQATALGLKHAYINQPVEVAALRPALAEVVDPGQRPDLVIRFGHGPTLPFAMRRPTGSVVVA
jgi:AcrR family transcriptional regulator